MSWQNSRPRGGSTAPKYRSKEHRDTRAAHLKALKQAGAGQCAQPVCLKRSRLITPDMQLDLAHDDSGTVYLGLAHRECNRTDGARRARASQTSSPLRW